MNPLSAYKVAVIVLSVIVVGTSGTATYYYEQQGSPVSQTADLHNQISNLNSQISNLNSQISSDKSQIDNLNQRISQLQSQPMCTPDSSYGTCTAEISALTTEITGLNHQINDLNSQASALQTQVNDLTDIVNLNKSKVVASSVTVNWASCGETGQPSCTQQNRIILQFPTVCTSTPCYAGYLTISWTSTQSLIAYYVNTVGSGTSTTVSTAGSTGDTSIPFAPGSFGGFENNACFYDAFNNLHCPGGTLTYTETYIY